MTEIDYTTETMVERVDEKGQGILYLCPTPIGNLEDITYRTLRVLRSVDYIGAEDTRHTGRLLHYFSIDKPLISYHEHNKEEKGQYLLKLALEGYAIAIVSDAGMPAISDPGADIVRKAIDAGVRVIPLPGANAALTALMASGLDTTEFTFLGFLPKRKRHRLEVLERIKDYRGTLLFYEAPHRIEEVLTQMYEVLGDRPCVLGRELTKKFETFTRATLGTLQEGTVPFTIKGEFVVLVGGAEEANSLEQEEPLSTSLSEAVAILVREGMAKKEAIRQIAKERGLARRDVYNAVERAAQEDVEDDK